MPTSTAPKGKRVPEFKNNAFVVMESRRVPCEVKYQFQYVVEDDSFPSERDFDGVGVHVDIPTHLLDCHRLFEACKTGEVVALEMKATGRHRPVKVVSTRDWLSGWSGFDLPLEFVKSDSA